MIGIRRVRVCSFEALIETARLGRRGRAPKTSKAGVIPDVDTVTRRGERTSKQNVERTKERPRGIEEGLAHPHEHHAESLRRAPGVGQNDVELSEDLARGQVPTAPEPSR